MALFRIPASMRPLVAGQVEVRTGGSTLAEALQDLSVLHPALASRLTADDGSIRPYISLFVQDEDVRSGAGLATPLAESESVVIIPAMAGG